MKFKFNIPNKITIIRVGLIPLFAIILLVDVPYKNLLAAFVFGMLSISDAIDGYFARKKRQVTEFGKLIDPIADKLLISTALIFLVGKGVELWMAAAIIAREFVITAVRIYLLPSKIVVPASNFGKAKTVLQSIAIIFVLLNLPFSWYMMLVAVLLTLISGLEYLIRIREMTGNKIVNLPNTITLARFLLIVPFVYYFLNSKIHISLLIFALIALSDKLDGISAKLMNQKTELGSGLDSFTDWTLIIATFMLLVTKNYVDILWVVLLVIPSIISGVIKMAYAKRQKIVPVTFIARLSVGLTYTTIISILINFRYAFYLLVVTVAIVYLAMVSYVFKALSMPKKAIKKKAH
ncbi:CDP-diacylglycerol--glycerol-3-phosphate 3-phosphatidyltransferase [Candidatus Woesearchaeota archaeon]|nr:CDP-diacylglycerol--glycerol-3-phosphate 3-phosphatidyltransferase [Candidatus Woesearchaeota archaeon]